MNLLKHFFKLKSHAPKKLSYIGADKALRDSLTEAQIDKTINDSFPASDPPAWY